MRHRRNAEPFKTVPKWQSSPVASANLFLTPDNTKLSEVRRRTSRPTGVATSSRLNVHIGSGLTKPKSRTATATAEVPSSTSARLQPCVPSPPVTNRWHLARVGWPCTTRRRWSHRTRRERS